MQRRRLLINAVSSVAQVIAVSAVSFVLYRFLIDAIGVDKFGIWSLILATTALTQIGDFGFTGSLVKFVAKYVALEDHEKISKVIQTGVVSTGIFFVILLAGFYCFSGWFLKFIIKGENLKYALDILPYAFISMWFSVLSGIFLSALDGFQRIDTRNMISTGGVVAQLVLCYILAPAYGLSGVAYATVIKSIMVFFVSLFFVKRSSRTLPLIMWKWDRESFFEITGYGINFQFMSVMIMLGDPVTKILLGKYGSLSAVGYYEMARKLIQQGRAVIVSANQVVVPAVADLKERIPEKVVSFYISSYRLVFFLSLSMFSALMVGMPLISEIWIGHFERSFVIFGLLLSVSGFLSALAGPAYFTNLGTGELRWNVMGHTIGAVLNAVLGVALGIYFGSMGVVVAFAIAMGASAVLIIFSYHAQYGISSDDILPDRGFMLTCLFGMAAAFFVRFLAQSSILANSVSILVFVAIFIMPFWRHPVRISLSRWVASSLLTQKGRKALTS